LALTPAPGTITVDLFTDFSIRFDLQVFNSGNTQGFAQLRLTNITQFNIDGSHQSLSGELQLPPDQSVLFVTVAQNLNDLAVGSYNYQLELEETNGAGVEIGNIDQVVFSIDIVDTTPPAAVIEAVPNSLTFTII